MFRSSKKSPEEVKVGALTFMSDRSRYLWNRVRNYSRIVGRLTHLNKDIQRFGTTHNSCRTIQGAAGDHVPWHIFLPNSVGKKGWNAIVVALLLITATVMPYRLCFETTTTQEWFIFELTIDFLFLLDILVHFNSAFYTKKNVLVTDRRSIAKEYVKSWFFIDLVACVPFQFIETNDQEADSEQNYNKLVRLLRIPRLYKLLKLIRLMKMIRLVRSQAFMTNLIGKLNMAGGIVRIIRFVFTVLVLVHLIGCLWYYLAMVEEENIDTWLYRYNLIGHSTSEIYLTAIYFVFTTLTTVGYGDIVPYTNLERLFAMLLMGFGAGFYSYMIGNLSTIIATMDLRRTNLNIRISTLNEFAKITKLPEDLRSEAKKFLKLNYTNSLCDLNTLVDEIPSTLRAEVSCYLYSTVTDKIYFFHNRSPSFLAFTVPLLKLVTLFLGDMLYYEGDSAVEVYFIHQGSMELLAANSVPFRRYSGGAYFGEIEVISQTYRNSSARAASAQVDLYILPKESFFNMLGEFADVKREVEKTAKRKQMIHQESKDEVLLLGPEPPEPVSSIEKSAVLPGERRASVILCIDEHESQVRRKNKAIWGQANDLSNGLTSYKEFLKRNETAISRFLTESYEHQRSQLPMLSRSVSYQRNPPQPQFKSPTVRSDRSDSLSQSSLSEVDLFENLDEVPGNYAVNIESTLAEFEEMVTDTVYAARASKYSQALLSASLQDLLLLKSKSSSTL